MLINAITFIVIFTAIALLHEFGHFIYAKRSGIRVFELGIGLGPRLLSFTKFGTIFSLNLIPILAFVRIAGEGEDKEDALCLDNEKYSFKTPFQKLKTLAAGPIMNILSAFLVLAIIFIFIGIPSGISNEIGSISSGSPAEKAGIKVGDKLLTINGKTFPNMEKAIDFIHKNANKSLVLTLKRGQQTLQIKAAPILDKKLNVGLLGFKPNAIYKRVSPIKAIYQSCSQTLSMIYMTLSVLSQLIIGKIPLSSLVGPIGLADVVGTYAQSGLYSITWLFAFISINIGVLNLLPIPALDGGRIVFALLELFRGKAIDQKLEMKINQWGMIALLTLMAFVSINDIHRLLGRFLRF